MSTPDLVAPTRRSWLRELLCLLLLAGLVAALHASALDDGLFMDDHAHFRQLRQAGWRPAELVDACRLELVGGTLDLWFLPECTLRFFRPLAMGLMKLTYELAGWNVAALHAASLGWHLLVCVLIVILLRRLGTPPLLAWAIAALFAIHPGHVVTVHWIACQTELMATAFLLAATLCYWRFRVTTGPRHGWAAATVLLFAAALGCRENAIMLPLVLVAAEPLVRARHAYPRPPGEGRGSSIPPLPLGAGRGEGFPLPHRTRNSGATRGTVLLLAALFLVAAAYVAARWACLGTAAVPPRPYLVPPGDPGFLRYVVDKACLYLLGEFIAFPTVPFGAQQYLQARPSLFYGLTGLICALIAAAIVRTRSRGAGLFGCAWLLAFMAPVLPVFAAPHHLYLPGIGWAVLAALIFQWLGGQARGRRLRPVRPWLLLALVGAWFGTWTLYFGEVIDVAQRVEDEVVANVAATPDLQDGDTLYLLNLPIVAHNVRLAVEEQTGHRHLRAYGLTWAPRVLGLPATDVRSELTWIDERTIEVRTAGARYFSGGLGALVTEGTGQQIPTQPAAHRAAHGFSADVLEADADGVAALRFTFDRPLSEPRVHLYWGSRELWAFEVRPVPHEP